MKYLMLILALSGFINIFAQDESITPLQYNTKLYYESLQYQNQVKSEFVQQNVIITTDTIELPFVDDFSRNTLKPFDFNETSIIDTVEFASGSCVINEDFTFEDRGFHTSPGFTYSYNLGTNTVDSIATAPVAINFYNNTDCFDSPSSVEMFWLPYYRLDKTDFDSITGARLDSSLSITDTIIPIATIFFANLMPEANWIDNYAYWNTTFPDLPITIGVATMDGLNEFGLPYNNSVQNAYGDADFLTSKSIDLSGLSNDSAVYLSFFYQLKGIGDQPDPEDSLVVQFRNEVGGSWHTVWSISPDAVTSNNFVQAYVEVRDTGLIQGPKYFYEEFQLRFKNKASISGNNDHWHIDYVRLDKNRNLVSNDSVIRDVSFLYEFPSYLKNYTLLPWNQLQAGADELLDSISIPIRSDSPLAGSFPLDVSITNSVTPDITFAISGQNFNATQQVKFQDFMPVTDFTLPVVQSDSLCSEALMFMDPTDRNLLQINDTIRHEICYDNVMAYDDGSAERAYGLEGGSPNEVKKFAYMFTVAEPDTLAAIQIHFSNIDVDVSNLVFSLQAWDFLELNQFLPEENLIGAIDNQKPVYVNERNGFATFVFDTPITVTDTFYVGWAQLDNRNLQVGYDINSTRGRTKMFVNTGNQWQASSVNIDGSPMVRVILDGDFPLATPIREVSAANNYLDVYPNPAQDRLFVKVPDHIQSFEVVVYDFTGRQLIMEQNASLIDVSDLPFGMFVIQLKEKQSDRLWRTKFFKR